MTVRNTDGHETGCLCKVCVGFNRARDQSKGRKPKPYHVPTHVDDCQCRPCVAVRNRLARSDSGAAVGRAASARANDPTVQPGGSPPLSNTGETERMRSVQLVLDGGKLKEVMVRLPDVGEVVHIDTVSFTVSENTFHKTHGLTLIDDDSIIVEASRVLENIFGFGISSERPGGMNFYQRSWVLGDGFGNVCFGGQKNTMLVTLNGTGCLNASPEWESRLQTFLESIAIRAVITRIDLAHDDFEGAYTSPEYFDAQWDLDGFRCGFGESPNIEHLGNWKKLSGAGRTIAVGKRTSGKYFRGYEKGCKEGDKLSRWFRSEVEFKSSDRVIPFDVLTKPSGYFVGAYPCFSLFATKVSPAKICIKKKTADISFEAGLDNVYRQFGKYIYMFRELFGDDKALLDRIANTADIPKRFKALGASIATCPTPLHLIEKPAFDLDAHLNSPLTFALRGNPA